MKICVEMMMLKEKIQQAIEYIDGFDFKTMADQAIKLVFEELAVRSEKVSNAE